MNKPSWRQALIVNIILIAACIVTLYPVLWVIKMALTPAQGFLLSLNPFPEVVSLPPTSVTHACSSAT